MGLSACPTPAGAGILWITLMGAVNLTSIFHGLFLFILQHLGIHVKKHQQASIDSLSGSYEYSSTTITTTTTTTTSRWSKSSYIEKFPKTTSAMRYDSVDIKCSDPEEHECTVCLTEFEPDSMIYLLSCGHVFHTTCLGTWLKYWCVTCPLCRTRIIRPLEEEYANPIL